MQPGDWPNFGRCVQLLGVGRVWTPTSIRVCFQFSHSLFLSRAVLTDGRAYVTIQPVGFVPCRKEIKFCFQNDDFKDSNYLFIFIYNCFYCKFGPYQ